MAYQNFFATRLATDIGAGDTAITLETAPSKTSGRLVLEARNPTQREIIEYTGLAGTQITGVTRGLGGTSAKGHVKNALVEMNLVAEDIQDLYDAFGSFAASNTSWFPIVHPVGTVTANGNRSYNITIPGVDVTDRVSEGMRIRTARTVAAPIQCASLNGTNQYFSKSSPSGMTFTDDFSVSAWVKLESYGGTQVIASRYNGTSGWWMYILSDGTVVLRGNNGGVSNFSTVTSYQSIPLGKWVHLAAQLDMSSFTATSTTSYIMIDGVGVPVSIARGGSNPTAIVQAGDLNIGAANGSSPFNGKIAQVAVYSAKVTQADHLARMNQGLTGSETSLVSAYSLSNSLEDLTANNNDLTANGSATTTNADSPFCDYGKTNDTDFGVIMAKSFSTDSTLTVQVPEGCTIPTSGGIDNISYSTQDVPYGFPRAGGRWRLEVISNVQFTQTSPTINTWYNRHNILIPTGEWFAGYELTAYASKTASAAFVLVETTLSSSSSTQSDALYTYRSGVTLNDSVNTEASSPAYKRRPLTVSSAANYYLNHKTSTTSMQSVGDFASVAPTIIYAECAYI